MSDRDALLSAICEQPDEDTPRLVFADYLEEHDEAPRAAFIRAQIQLALTPPWEPFAVRCRWHTPGTVSGAAFRPTLPKLEGAAVEWHPSHPFRRGFGWMLKVRTPSLWDSLAAPLFERQPVGKVAFWGAPLDDWRRIASSGCIRHLREMMFVLSPIEPLFALRDRAEITGVTDLHFTRASGAGMPEVLEDLFRSRLGHAVRGLHFHSGTHESLDALLDALNTGAPLDRLSFSVMELTTRHLRRLFDGPAAGGATELHFRNELFGGEGLRVLADLLPHTARDLTLVNIGMRADGLELLVRSDRLVNLKRLDLSNNPLTPRAVKVLSLSHALAALRAVNLSSCHLGDKGVRHVTLAKWWHGLVEVDLRNNAISPAGVKHLLNAPVPPDLTALVLDRDAFGAESRAALARKFGDAAVFVAGDPLG